MYTKTLKPSGGDYSTLLTWEATEPAIFDAQGDPHELLCDAFEDTGGRVAIDSFTTSSETKTITVKAADGVPRGVRGQGYRISGGVAWASTIFPTNPGISFDGIEIINDNPGTGGLNACAIRTTSQNSVVKNCICVLEGLTASQNETAALSLSQSRVSSENNLCIVIGSYGVGLYRSTLIAAPAYMSNDTTIGGEYGFRRGGTNTDQCTISNMNCFGASVACIADDTGSNTTFVNCASSDSTATGTGAVTGVTTADFLDYAAGDYRPACNGVLAAAGTTPPEVAKDITGYTRNDPDDIGAFARAEYYIKTLKSSGGDYSTISTWQATEAALFNAQPGGHWLVCDAFTSNEASTRILIDSFTTADRVTKPVIVKPAAGAEHNGISDAGFVLTAGDAWGSALQLNNQIILDGIEVRNDSTTTGNSPVAIVLGVGSTINCLASVPNSTSTGGSVISVTSTEGVVDNCLVQRQAGMVIEVGQWAACTLNNVTAIGGDYGFRRPDYSGGDPTLNNCVSYGAAIDCFEFSSSPVVTMNNCASSDSTATGTGAVTGVTSAAFYDYAGGDYRPVEGGVLDGAGTSPALVFYDIKGLTRTDPDDIGAFIAVPGSSNPITFDGPDVPNQTGTDGQAFAALSPTVASRFSGTATPFTYTLAPDSNPLPAGLSINPTTGNVEGTPTETGTFTGLKIRGTGVS